MNLRVRPLIIWGGGMVQNNKIISSGGTPKKIVRRVAPQKKSYAKIHTMPSVHNEIFSVVRNGPFFCQNNIKKQVHVFWPLDHVPVVNSDYMMTDCEH